MTRKKRKLPIAKVILFALFIMIAGAAGVFLQILSQLPDIETIESYLPSETTLILSSDGKTLARLHREENRQVVSLSQISPYMQRAVISTEDPSFYRHHGFDLYGIFRATVKNLAYGRVVEGGSTITQQLARNLFLNRRKTMIRKLAEILIAMQIERKYTKEEILELYLNQIYLGHNAYGIESAARLYFNKTAAELDLAESAMLAGLIRGPELYSPYRNFKGAKLRQIFVLNKLLEHKLVDERDAKIAAIKTLDFSPKNLKRFGETAPYFISYILGELIKEYGEETVYHSGLRVYTTLDTKMQAAAEAVITKFVSEEGERYKFSQAALVSLDPRTGYIKAMVGGVDFYESKFNRATQAKRQPGSSFKPFVYTAAMEQGISPGEIILDSPTTFEVFPNEWNPEGTWTPNNFDKKFHGAVTLRHALEKSLNIPAIKILERVGIHQAIATAKKMGITSHIEPGLAIPLGVSDVTLLEMTSAYGVFANSGIRVEPTAITKILNRDGVILYKHNIKEKRVLDTNIAAVMVDMMKGVLTRGTGVRGRISRPAAAKTGTTEEFRDAWFMGFVPQLVTGIWVGNDDNTSMDGIAEVGVCPRIWKEYNKIVLADEPIINFPRPEGLVKVKICTVSKKLVNDYCPSKYQKWVTLWKRDVPKSSCDVHKPGDNLYEFEIDESGEIKENPEVWD
ncbi:MAG: PBP1A family penicillin-binding protein [Candidatus Margulisbacteria bacterium]|nr:PBP1A family penicillin-binding protein [Candidatus Margulisiibacteriota bacterium]